jgi:microcystin degradation protein MlrC
MDFNHNYKTYSRSNIKNSMELLDNFDSHSFWKMSSTQTLDIWTLYATIPHEKWKISLKQIIHNIYSPKK